MSAAAVLSGLEDVRDVEAFAIRQVNRSAFARDGNLTGAEREECVQEAVALIFELHGEWDPERCELFSAFLIHRLPRRLISWYRVNLRQSGRGRWSGSTGEYKYNGTVSLDDRGPDAADPTDRALTVHGPGA